MFDLLWCYLLARLFLPVSQIKRHLKNVWRFILIPISATNLINFFPPAISHARPTAGFFIAHFSASVRGEHFFLRGDGFGILKKFFSYP